MESGFKMQRVLETDLVEQIKTELQLELEQLQRTTHEAVLDLNVQQVLKNSVGTILNAVAKQGKTWQPYVLNLSGRKLTLEDLEALSAMISGSPELLYLELSECQLGFPNYEDTADAIYIDLFNQLLAVAKIHPGLRVLNLGNINFKAENHPSILELVKENKILLQLSLAGNTSVGLEMGRELLVALESNLSLLSLNVAATELASEYETLEHQKTYQSLEEKLLTRGKEFRDKFRSTKPSFDPVFVGTFNVPNSLVNFLEGQNPNLVLDHTGLIKSPLLFIKKQQIRLKSKLEVANKESAAQKHSPVKVIKPQMYVGSEAAQKKEAAKTAISIRIKQECELELMTLQKNSHEAVLDFKGEIMLKNSVGAVLETILNKGKEWQPYAIELFESTLMLEDFLSLITLVEKSPNLIYLSLQKCQLGFNENNFSAVHINLFVKLIEAVKVHPSLRVLKFDGINFSDDIDIITALGQLIAENKTLLCLSLSENKNVRLELGNAIVAALEQNETILSLPISLTPLTEDESFWGRKYSQVENVSNMLNGAIKRHRQNLLNKCEYGSGSAFIFEINIPDSMVPFLEKFYHDSSFSSFLLEYNPLLFIKKKQEQLNKELNPILDKVIEPAPPLIFSHTAQGTGESRQKREKLSIELSSSGSLTFN